MERVTENNRRFGPDLFRGRQGWKRAARAHDRRRRRRRGTHRRAARPNISVT